MERHPSCVPEQERHVGSYTKPFIAVGWEESSAA